jgi:MSHA biogenesis protein MshQ
MKPEQDASQPAPLIIEGLLALPKTWLAVALFSLGVMLWSAAAQAVTYANASTTFGWIDASTHTKLGPTLGAPYSALYRFSNTGGCGTNPPSIDDTLSSNIPIGFTFMYGGVNFTDVRIMSNGRLQFNNNLTCGFGSPVTQLPYPNAGLNYTLRIYGGDLDPSLQAEIGGGYVTNCLSRNLCYVSYATLGTAPYRSFVVTWSNVPEWTSFASATGSYNVQVILQENGEFVYQYGTNVPGPGNTVAQVGWQVDSNDYHVPAVGYPPANTATKFYIARPVAEYRMEQVSWSGVAAEVLDTSGNARHGTAVSAGASTRPAEVVTGKVCRGGQMADNATAADISAIDTTVPIPTTVGGVGTITFWYNNSSNDRMLFDATVANGQWFYLMRTNNRTLRFVITDSTGARRAVETAANAIPNAGWTHIAVTWNFNALAAANSDRLRVYVNGVLSVTSAFSTAGSVSASVGTLYIGDNRSGFIDAIGPGTGRSAGNPGGTGATIDEFRIYNYEGGVALVQRDMNQAGACLSHYAIAASGTPTVCVPVQPVQVTVTAHDNSHGAVTMPNNTTQITLSIASTSTPSTTPTAIANGGNWSLVSGYGTFSNGTADDGLATYIFNGEYQAVLSYQPTVSGNVYAHVTDGQIVESENVMLSVTGCPPSSFNGCEPAAPQCTPTAAPALGYAALFTKLASTGFDLEAVALKPAGTLENTFAGSVTVDLLANINTGVAIGANNCPASQTATIPLGNATFSSGRTTISNINVANAYRDVRMRFTCSVVDCGSAITHCSSDNFAIRPQSFTVTANLGGATLPAGNNFTMTATTAVPAGYTGTPTVNSALVQDHNAATAGVLSGGFAAATGSGASGTFQYHDVGTISLQSNAVTDSGYTTVDQAAGDCVAASASNTLASGKYGCNVGSAAAGPFGRFYPHHFTYAATLTPACVGGGFTYMNQPALGITLALTAKSANETTTARYTAGYPTLGTFSIDGDNGGTAVAPARVALPAFIWSNGVYTTVGAHTFTRNSTPDGPYNSFALKATVTDPDGAAIAGAVLSNTTAIRSGRLRLVNTYGSELLAIRVPLRAESYTGTGWSLHAADSCTAIPTNAIAITNSGALAPVIQSPSPITLNGGLGTLVFNATAAAGSFDLAANLNAAGVDTSCNPAHGGAAANMPWLQGFWSSTCNGTPAWAQDPNARIRAGSPKAPYIYLRERY